MITTNRIVAIEIVILIDMVLVAGLTSVAQVIGVLLLGQNLATVVREFMDPDKVIKVSHLHHPLHLHRAKACLECLLLAVQTCINPFLVCLRVLQICMDKLRLDISSKHSFLKQWYLLVPLTCLS
jgi:hypothetical protein